MLGLVCGCIDEDVTCSTKMSAEEVEITDVLT